MPSTLPKLRRRRISFVTADARVNDALDRLAEKTVFEPRLLNSFIQRAFSRLLDTKVGRDLLAEYGIVLSERSGTKVEGFEELGSTPQGLDVKEGEWARQNTSTVLSEGDDDPSGNAKIGAIIDIEKMLGGR